MEQNKNNEMVNTIKKLLELSKSKVNSHEAEVAALKAQKIMAKYGISISEISDEEKDDIGYSRVDIPAGKAWKFHLAPIVADNFRCRVFFYGTKACCFYGHLQDTEVAKLIFEFLFNGGNKSANNEVYKYRKRNGTAEGVYNSFIFGYLKGLKLSLSEQSKALSLVVPVDVDEAYEEMKAAENMRVKETKKSVKILKDSYNRGYECGKNIMKKRELGSANV